MGVPGRRWFSVLEWVRALIRQMWLGGHETVSEGGIDHYAHVLNQQERIKLC
jgi:hypothetical protein